jgi:hypothetical protein
MLSKGLFWICIDGFQAGLEEKNFRRLGEGQESSGGKMNKKGT